MLCENHDDARDTPPGSLAEFVLVVLLLPWGLCAVMGMLLCGVSFGVLVAKFIGSVYLFWVFNSAVTGLVIRVFLSGTREDDP